MRRLSVVSLDTKTRNFLTCGGTDNSKYFVKDYCKEAVELGIYDSIDACIDSEGKAIEKGLENDPHQDRFIFGKRKANIVKRISEESFWGGKDNYDEQRRYPNDMGDIHSRFTESGGTAVVHRDVCPPSKPMRHLTVDFFSDDETAKELEI